MDEQAGRVRRLDHAGAAVDAAVADADAAVAIAVDAVGDGLHQVRLPRADAVGIGLHEGQAGVGQQVGEVRGSPLRVKSYGCL